MARRKNKVIDYTEPIKWNDYNERRLKKAVQQFNSRVKSLKQNRKDKSYIPRTIGVTTAKKQIATEEELENVIKSLGRFKGSKAYKKVELPSGETLTSWEYTELLKEQEKAQLYLQKRLKELKRPVSKMGEMERAKVKSALKSVKSFEKLTGSEFDIARERISRYSQSDYDMKKAILYQKNYLKMLKEEYSDSPLYAKLRREIRKANPLKFYNDLEMAELNEYLTDITFMYDNSNREDLFESLVEIYLPNEEGE